MTNYILPKNLNLKKLEVEFPKIKGFKFNPEHCKEILSLIHEIPIDKPWIDSTHGFVPLMGKLLAKKYRGYKNYVNYFVDQGILEIDHYYKPGKKCKGYRFTPKYHTDLIFLYKKETTPKQHPSKSLNDETYLHLEAPFDSLEINTPAALGYLEAIRFNNKQGQKDNKIQIRLNRGRVAIERIIQKNYCFSLGKKTNRLYSILTNMPKEIRHFLTCNGQYLDNLDIKNSQPYFLSTILNISYWIPEPNQTGLNIEKINIENIKYRAENIKSIMVDKLSSPDFETEKIRYQKLVSKGILYPFLEEAQDSLFGFKYFEGSDFKLDFIKGLFGHNRLIGRCYALKVFKFYFPLIYDLISTIKRLDKTFLAQILQHIESYLILNVITKSISQKYPGIYFYTIHDSIATTENNVSLVKLVMEEFLTKYVGVPPKLGIENWRPGNLPIYLSSN